MHSVEVRWFGYNVCLRREPFSLSYGGVRRFRSKVHFLTSISILLISCVYEHHASFTERKIPSQVFRYWWPGRVNSVGSELRKSFYSHFLSAVPTLPSWYKFKGEIWARLESCRRGWYVRRSSASSTHARDSSLQFLLYALNVIESLIQMFVHVLHRRSPLIP